MTLIHNTQSFVASFLIALGTLLTGCASDPDAHNSLSPLAELAWLSGSWRDVSEGATTTEEHWTLPAGGSMLGTGRTLRPVGGDPANALATVSYEFLRISAEPDGRVVYFASPQGRYPPTSFTLETTPGLNDRHRLVFTNPAHIFPQRIVYEKQGQDRVLVSISTLDAAEGSSMSWTLHRNK